MTKENYEYKIVIKPMVGTEPDEGFARLPWVGYQGKTEQHPEAPVGKIDLGILLKTLGEWRKTKPRKLEITVKSSEE
ncbi:hypothetical protein HYT24_01975 [Candidatus Pacearchaeota archaeon]|nr:hypothetical protein [Candidatus Pacearchaeota archaeon]